MFWPEYFLCLVDVTLINMHSAQVFVNIYYFDMLRPKYFKTNMQRPLVKFFCLI